MILVIDYNTGNPGSILNMLKKIGAQAFFSANPQDFEHASKFILPGVGSFDNGIQNLINSGLIPALEREVIGKKKPVIGICLGMQMLGLRSEEGKLSGLGWIDFECIRFNFKDKSTSNKVPHMGWNTIAPTRKDPIFSDTEAEQRFYFVHSYHAVCNNSENALAYTHYNYDFASVVQRGNIYGVQFHPEKSHRFGMKLLRNFAEM